MKTYILETVFHSHTTPKETVVWTDEKSFWQVVKDWALKMQDSENLIREVTLDFCEAEPDGNSHRLLKSLTITNYEADPAESLINYNLDK
jgi:hypothetical protein